MERRSRSIHSWWTSVLAEKLEGNIMLRCGMTYSLKSIEVSRSLLSHPKRLIDLHLLDLIFALIDLQHSRRLARCLTRTPLMWS
jgi:hypothetical protein